MENEEARSSGEKKSKSPKGFGSIVPIRNFSMLRNSPHRLNINKNRESVQLNRSKKALDNEEKRKREIILKDVINL